MTVFASFKKLTRTAVLLAAFVAVLLSAATPSHAQQIPGVEVLEFGAESQFPEHIRFWATVESDREIEDVRVNFSVGARLTTQYNYLELQPGESADITEGEFFHRVDTNERYIPPGAVVTYWLEVFDEQGNVHRSAEQQMIVTDARWNNWESVTDGPVTVYYRATATRAASLASAARQSLEKMQPITGADISDPITMTLYNNNADMIGAVVGRSGATTSELITEGQAFAEENVVLVLAGRNDIGTATHEITHILVGRAAGGTAFVPLWVNEGLAEHGNLDPTVSYTRYLEWAIDTHRLTPLRNLRNFPGDPNLTLVSYGQSRSAVAYMIETYGPEKMAELLQVLGSGRTIDAAMQQVYGMGIDDFDNEWRESIGAEAASPQAAPTPRPSATATPTAAATVEPTPAEEVDSTPAAEPTITQNEAGSAGTCNALPGGPLPIVNVAGLAMLGMIGTWRVTQSRRR